MSAIDAEENVWGRNDKNNFFRVDVDREARNREYLHL